jgi:hypothetical protein
MAGQDKLLELEAERDRLLSMIAYHDRPMLRIPPWFYLVAVGMICGIGVLIVAGIFAGQIALSGLIFSVVFLGLAAYISTRKITMFGTTLFAGEILASFGGGVPAPIGRPAGELEAHQRLADCEAHIAKLKEGRP